MAIKNNWWKKTFSKTYFSLYNPSSLYSQTLVKKVLKLINDLHLQKGSKILDVPCGQGRHSVKLAKRNFQVTGIDYSSTALQAAKKWAHQNKVSPVFIKQDMRSLKLNERFDAVIMLGNSFGYFSDADNEKVIKNISALLKRNGFFVIHLLNPIERIRQFKNKKKNKFRILHGYVNIENISFDPINFIEESRWTIIRNGRKKTLDVRLRLYTFPEIHSLFSRYKLNIIKTYGSFDKKPYSFKSPIMIIVAKKKI
jgi:2-polyprenyl-3-methyl-5-hydroxy-6-metoxy-1,4-benzoquinol methylase